MFFSFQNFFYNDFRSQSAIDYSKPILDWLSNCKNEAEEKWEHIMNGQLVKKQKEILGYPSKTNLPIFKSRDMDSARFCDLRFRLGAGYLYCHQVCFFSIYLTSLMLIPLWIFSKKIIPLQARQWAKLWLIKFGSINACLYFKWAELLFMISNKLACLACIELETNFTKFRK